MPLVEPNPNFSDLAGIPGIRIDLKYASTDNFMGENVYGDLRVCFLHPEAASKLKHAVGLLRSAHPGFSLLVYDGLRPRSVQRKMWAKVLGTPAQAYVAEPEIGSMHNYGLAVDLSVTDAHGNVLDMGAGFDDFREISQPRLEPRFLASGELSQIQLQNRLILRSAMQGAGFIQLEHEWWHYNAMAPEEAAKKYKILD
jgi:D-alanyl-D-alanine dipeptidase